MMIGAPAISMNCFGICPPNLLPLPAAGMIATFIKQWAVGIGQWAVGIGQWAVSFAIHCPLPLSATHYLPPTGSVNRRRRRRDRTWLAVAVIAPRVAHFWLLVFDASEDHFARRGLQDASYDHIDIFTDKSARVVDHDHRAVVQIGHALVVLFAFLENEDPHYLAGQHDGLERVGQLVDVEHFDAAQVGDLIEIEVVGHDRRVELFAKFDQLQVDLAHIREIGFVNLHVEVAVFLDALKDVQSSPATVALGGIGRVGDLLQLAQDELRDENRAAHKTGLGDVGDAPVNNHAGVENLVALLRPAVDQDAAERREVEVVTFGRADQQPDVGHEERERQGQEGFDRLIPVLRGDQEPDQRRADDAEDRACRRPDQGLQRGPPDSQLEEDYPARQQRAGDRRKRPRPAGDFQLPTQGFGDWLNQVAGDDENDDEY